MTTLKQIVEKNCDGKACTGTKKEVYGCVTYNVREWLQHKHTEALANPDSGRTYKLIISSYIEEELLGNLEEKK